MTVSQVCVHKSEWARECERQRERELKLST